MSRTLTIPPTPKVPLDVPDVRVHPPVVYVQPVWEYKHVLRKLSEGAPPSEEQLNSLGAEGWELVGVAAEAGATHFYFKRLVR